MRNRRAATRFALRRLARKGILDKAKARAILRDDDATEMVSDFVQDKIEADGIFSAEDGPIIAFVKWIFENQEMVLKFIEALIALFDPEEVT